MPNPFQAALAERIDANNNAMDVLAKIASLAALSTETVKQVVDQEKGPTKEEIQSVANVLGVDTKKVKAPSKNDVPEPEAGGARITMDAKKGTVTLEGFAELPWPHQPRPASDRPSWRLEEPHGA